MVQISKPLTCTMLKTLATATPQVLSSLTRVQASNTGELTMSITSSSSCGNTMLSFAISNLQFKKVYFAKGPLH